MKFPKKIKLPSRRIRRDVRSLGWLYAVLTLSVIGLGFGLYFFHPVFQQNVDIAMAYLFPHESEIVQQGPLVSQKDGQAFILYDHPLVGVTILQDSECRGSRCTFVNLADELKRQITPLLNVRTVDYRSERGQSLARSLDWPMLPVVVFDNTLSKIRGFEQLQELFVEDGEQYLLRLQPSTTRVLPEYGNALMSGHLNGDYPVKIVAYGNYTCSYCGRAQGAINQLLAKYPDDITIFYKHFARTDTEVLGARAAECSAMQGRFDQMHELLFDSYETLRGLEYPSYFNHVMGLAHRAFIPNQVEFKNCIESRTFDEKISKHREEAQTLGIDTTPIFFINDAVIPGSMDFSEFDAVVRGQLSLK